MGVAGVVVAGLGVVGLGVAGLGVAGLGVAGLVVVGLGVAGLGVEDRRRSPNDLRRQVRDRSGSTSDTGGIPGLLSGVWLGRGCRPPGGAERRRTMAVQQSRRRTMAVQQSPLVGGLARSRVSPPGGQNAAERWLSSNPRPAHCRRQSLPAVAACPTLVPACPTLPRPLPRESTLSIWSTGDSPPGSNAQEPIRERIVARPVAACPTLPLESGSLPDQSLPVQHRPQSLPVQHCQHCPRADRCPTSRCLSNTANTARSRCLSNTARNTPPERIAARPVAACPTPPVQHRPMPRARSASQRGTAPDRSPRRCRGGGGVVVMAGPVASPAFSGGGGGRCPRGRACRSRRGRSRG